MTITSGQTATYNLLLVPGVGFAGNVSVACGGGPAKSTCTASPSTLNVAGVNTIPFTVTVATSASGFVPVSIFRQWLLLHAPACMLLLFVCLTGKLAWATAHKKHECLVYSGAVAVLALIALLAAAGCGGGGSAAQGAPVSQPVTPSPSTRTRMSHP
jgi:hypothetical protein